MGTVTTTFHSDKGLISQVVSGTLTVEDVREAFDRTISHPDFVPSMHAVWDLSNASLEKVPKNDIRELVEFIDNQISQRGKDFKVAIVVSQDFEYGIARMFTGYGEKLPFQKNVFRSMEAAQEWLDG